MLKSVIPYQGANISTSEVYKR